jgi:hypothetical protein
MSRDPFAGFLDPFALWDISATYDHYSAFFDLAIYTAIFVALAQSVYGLRFQGRPGRILSSAVGLGLAISLTLAEEQFGWNLRAAGPIAAVILLVLVGVLILHVMLKAHVAWRLAAPLTYVLLYMFVRALSPELFDMIMDRAPFIHLLSAVVLLVCVWQFGVALWPGGGKSAGRTWGDEGIVPPDVEDRERREIRVERQIRRNWLPHARRSARHLGHDLRSIKKALSEPEPPWADIRNALANASNESNEIDQIIQRIQYLDDRLRNFDWRELRELESHHNGLTREDQPKLKAQIHLERRKIHREHAIKGAIERTRNLHRQFQETLDQAIKVCSYQNATAAHQSITQAIKIEAARKKELKNLQKAETRLMALAQCKLKEEND